MDEEAARVAFERGLHGTETHLSFFHRFLGVKMAMMEERAVVTLQHELHLANRQGRLHGGIVALILDMTMGYLHRNVLGPGVTVEIKVQYSRAVTEGLLICEAWFQRKGRRTSFIEARLTNEERLVASATATWMPA